MTLKNIYDTRILSVKNYSKSILNSKLLARFDACPFNFNECVCKSFRPKSAGSVLFAFYTSMIFLFLFFVAMLALKSSHGSGANFFPSPMFRYVAFGVQDEWSTPGYCSPAVNIFFLKTHKCASSSVQNIFMRYGDEKNLTFILPEESNYIGHPQKFSRSMLTEQMKMYSNFNLLCHHLRFDAHEVESVMSPKTFYVSILRDPASLFRSMYDYYNMQKFFNRTLKAFLQDEGSMKALNSQRIYDKLGRNQMLFDFGYDKDIWDNVSLIRSAIEEIDERFDFIMISELFDESLILLKHMLCWTTADIVYLKHNMRKNDIYKKKDDSLVLKIKDYNAADKLLYDYFHEKLLGLIDSFGKDRMAREIQDLRLWNSVWFNHCIKKMSSSNEDIPSETKAYNSKVYSFVLNDEPIAEICKHLAMEELQYTAKLREKQKTFYELA